jgi:hypothetical protein
MDAVKAITGSALMRLVGGECQARTVVRQFSRFNAFSLVT